MIGRTLDRYRIDQKLGEGGMGVVYKAHDTHLDRVVAIKVLLPDKVSDPDRRQRFVHEARAASALNHPNIVTLHDIRSEAGIDFIVMEYAPGRTLAELIPARGLGVTQALRYGVQIADALARAHEAGIVHRDLKPSNVIVTDGDRVKVLDFGLAKLLELRDLATDAHTRTSPVTEAGMVVGTAAYMSPEQAQGQKVDARSDVFSFGAVLYEMVTGRRPFAGDSQLSILARILNDDPAPPSTLNTSVPHDVERTILRCLRKDPARRYQTMADLKVALEDLALDSAAVPAEKPPARSVSRPWRWAWAALIPVGLVAAYLWTQMRPPQERAAPVRAVPLTAQPGEVGYPSFSPDGNYVAFSWTGPKQDNRDIYVQQIGAGSPLPLTRDPANDFAPVWSPDGRAIAFLRQSADPRRYELRLIPPLGGTDRRLAEIQPRGGFLRAVTLGWCPDSRCVVLTDASSPDVTKADGLFAVSIESGEKKQLTAPQPPFLADTDPAISPDGRWLVVRRDVAPFSGRLQLVRLDASLTTSGEPRSITPILLTAYGPKWISNREIVFWAKSALWRIGTEEGATPERLAFVGEDGMMPAVWPAQSGRPGRLAYVRNIADLNIWRIELSSPGAEPSSPPVVAIASTRRDVLPQFSDDGRRIAFLSDRSGESEVWVADASGDNAVQLTSLGANPGFPRWSPDGRRIAFHCNSESHPYGAVHVIPADGGRVQQMTSNPSTDAFPSFSRDGRWIYFSSSRSGTPCVWKIPADGGSAVKVSPTAGLLALESRDGAYLYYVEAQNSNATGPLWQLPLKGGEPVKLAEGVIATSFDVVDGGIYYLERHGAGTRLRYFDFATRQSRLVAENLGNSIAGIGASPDGRTILYTRVDSSLNNLMLVENFR